MARLRLREVSESEERFNRLERAMRYGKRLKLAQRAPRDIFLPEDKTLWFLFERIYTVVHDKEVAVLKRFGLTPMQYNVLEFIYVSSCNPSLGFVVDELRMSYGNLFVVVKNLVKKGLVICDICPNDKRSKSLALTYEGKLLFEEVQVIYDKVLGNMFSAMCKNKKREIKSNLSYVLRHFSPEKIE
ncbi:MarR family winged helix-turn-helix transcriptional regulator [uncultured Veillonella sp.]|uniref:MarR family winged helix-turn-helix transcriptional regulator n=1 Tax=uncultured Veillonella sp. TaxID=159268 RepID=UPI0025D099CF|nr:MarR family transcriptional regulator [uncultured Veillonella sp.]